MGVVSLPPGEINKLSAGGLSGVESVLEFPYPKISDFSRYKLFPAQGDMKYFQRKDSGNHLYILSPVHAVLTDFREKLYFVEGEKKAAAAVQRGLHAVGFSGVWNWKNKDSWKGIDELQLIPFADRDVEIIPDSDTWTRDDLQRAVYAFGKYLESRGARAFVTLIPPNASGKLALMIFSSSIVTKIFGSSRDSISNIQRWPNTNNGTTAGKRRPKARLTTDCRASRYSFARSSCMQRR